MHALELIKQERNRQRDVEGWTDEHDDQWTNEQLARAAATYAMPLIHRVVYPMWPWFFKWWKPTPENRLRELVKAGALIVAEIDRLERRCERQRQQFAGAMANEMVQE
jgi:hypothetical protein